MSTVIVEPGAKSPTHHISLSDGQTTLGLIMCNSRGEATGNSISRAPITRTALKTASGSSKWSDFEPPWSPVAQEDFSGGMGSRDFDDDTTRFLESMRANTQGKRIYLGGQETYATGLRSVNANMPGSVSWRHLLSSNGYLSVSFSASANYDIEYISVYIRRRGTPSDDLTIELCANGGGSPGTVIRSATITTDDITDTVSVFYKSTITATSVSSGTTYWITAHSANGDDENHWEIGVNNTTGTSKDSADGSTWATATVDMYFRATAAETYPKRILFKYQYAEYMLQNYASGTPKLYINGDRGVADANTGALTTLVDATKSWTVNEWAGCIVKITRGNGVGEETTYRTIVSNTATTLTVSSAWVITHNTTTEYVILGSNKFTELATATGLTASVTDVMIVNNIVYLCQGDDVVVRMWRWYNNSGTEKDEFTSDGTNKALFMETVRDSTSGMVIWRANNSDASGYVSVSKASVTTWGSALSYATAITYQDQWGRITGIQEYDAYLWVLREGTVFRASGTATDEINLSEIHTMMESTNGIAHMVANVYLYFNLGAGIERYYNGTLDDVGPNRDDGLPSNRQGIVTCMLGYPGRYYVAVDGGESRYSSILMHNGTGWCDVYVSPNIGERILSMDIQTIPGTAPDRLWVSVGSSVIWLPLPSLTLDPTKDSNYRYTHEATLTSGYIYCGMVDAFKQFNSLKLFTENLSDGQTVEVDYQVDDDTAWTPIDGVWNTSPMQEYQFSEYESIEGKRIRYRLRIMTEDNSKTPIVKTSVVDVISQVQIKYSYAVPFRNKDNDVDLMGTLDPISADERGLIIDEWANNMTRLTMRSLWKRYDNRRVFINPTPNTPTGEIEESFVERLTVSEL